MKTSTILAVVSSVITLTSAAFAQTAPSVAAPVSPPSATTSVPVDQSGVLPREKTEHPLESVGATLRLGLFVNSGTGDIAKTLPTATTGVGIDASVSYTFARSFGVEGQILLSVSGLSGDCTECSYGRRSLPLTLQWNADSRKHGFYAGAGVSLLNTGNIRVKSAEIGTLSALAAGTGYLGYRIPLASAPTPQSAPYAAPVRQMIDTRLQVMRLDFDELRVDGTSGPVASDKRNPHFEVMLTAAWAFAL